MWGQQPDRAERRMLRIGAARVRYGWPLYVALCLFLIALADAWLIGWGSHALRGLGMNSEASRSFPTLVALSVVPIAFMVRWNQIRRVRQLLASHGYLICLKCHYPISSDLDQGRCPECSEDYQTADVITAWQEWESLQSRPVHGE